MPALLSPKGGKTDLLSPPSIDTTNSQLVTQPIETHPYALGQIVHKTDGPVLGLHLIQQARKQAICVVSRTELALLSTQYFHALQSINHTVLPAPISCCYYALHNQSINLTGDQSKNPIVLGHEDGSITLLDPHTLAVQQSEKCHTTAVTCIATTNQSVSQPNNAYLYSVDSARTQLLISSLTNLERIDEYVEHIGLIDCLLAEAGGVVWLGCSNGTIQRLLVSQRAITHTLTPADTPIKQPVNQLLNQVSNQINQSNNNTPVGYQYGPIRCLYASQSPPPVVKKAKKKKGEEDSVANQTHQNDPTIIIWSTHGFASLTAWDTRPWQTNNQSTTPPNNQVISQSMIVHQQRLTFDSIASVQHSFQQLSINQSINQSALVANKQFSPTAQISTRSNARALLNQPQSINRASNQVINCMLVHDQVLYTGQEDGVIGVVSLSNEQAVTRPTSSMTSARMVSPTPKPKQADSQPAPQPTVQSNPAPRRQLVEVDIQASGSINHIIIVTNNEEQAVPEPATEPATEQSDDQSDKASLMEEKVHDDNDTEDTASTKPANDQSTASSTEPVTQPTNPLCPSPYLLVGTRSGSVHVVPHRVLSYEVAQQVRALNELDQAARDEWREAKTTKASKSSKTEKKKK